MAGERLKEERDVVTIACGANPPHELEDVSGLTVTDVCNRMEDIMNLPHPVQYVLNGTVVDGSYVLKAGDHIECMKPAGVKG